MTDTRETLAAEAQSPRARGEAGWAEEQPTGLLVLADGTIIEGKGAGAAGIAVGEVCFNTAMTGYQEILTDPSYAGQIITFTFPHIGNVGTNGEDMEAGSLATGGVRGCVLRATITAPSNWRACQDLDAWLKATGVEVLAGSDFQPMVFRLRLHPRNFQADRSFVGDFLAGQPDYGFTLLGGFINRSQFDLFVPPGHRNQRKAAKLNRRNATLILNLGGNSRDRRSAHPHRHRRFRRGA